MCVAVELQIQTRCVPAEKTPPGARTVSVVLHTRYPRCAVRSVCLCAARRSGLCESRTLCGTRLRMRAPKCPPQKASFSPLSCTRGSQRTNAHRTFEDIKVGCALRPSRRLSSVAARRASPLDSALRVDLETTLGHRQLHPDASHMRRVSPPRVSLYSILGCELKKAHSAPAASSSTHAVLVPLGWPEDDSQYKIGKTSRGAV